MEPAVGNLKDCAICMEELSSPKFLPCHHTFCLECINTLRLSHPKKLVKCPLCRSEFNAPTASFPINTYADELVRLTLNWKSTENQMKTVTDELMAVKAQLEETECNLDATETQLEETEEARQETVEEKCRLDIMLAETKTQLTQLENHSSQVEKQLEELAGNLSAAETRESCLRQQQREIVEQLKDAERRYEAAKIDAETCGRAKEDAEVQMKESYEIQQQQLHQMQQEGLKQLKEARRKQKEATIEAETCKRAKNGVEASLAKAKRSFRSLQQQLKQTQQEKETHTKMLQTELGQMKQEVVSLNEQLSIERLKLAQQQDYKKSHAEVVRLCLVLFAMFSLTVIGALILLEDRSMANVKTKEEQLIACNNLAGRLEENANKLEAARYEARDMSRMLSACSEQLSTTQQALDTTEMKLRDTMEVLNGTISSRNKNGKPVDATSDLATKELTRCSEKLEKARAGLHDKEMMLENCSSYLVQEREDKIAAAATAKECSLHATWLQQILEDVAFHAQDPVTKEAVHDVKKNSCSGPRCNRESKESKNANAYSHTNEGGVDNPTEPIKTTANSRCDNCTRQLSEARANLSIQEVMLKNCSSHLTQEHKETLRITASAEECARQLNQSGYHLELETATRTQCENQLEKSTDNLTAVSSVLDECRRDLRKISAEVELARSKDCACDGNQRSKQSKGESAKLTKCQEELTTALETARWKTKQMDKCADNLVKARSEVQSLNTRLAETNSACESIIENLKLRHQQRLKTVVADLQIHYKEEIDKAVLECEVQQLSIALCKSIFVIPFILMFFGLFTVVGHKLFMTFASYAIRLKALLGIRGRQVMYRVNFERPRYRR